MRPWLIGDSEEAATWSSGPSAVGNSTVSRSAVLDLRDSGTSGRLLVTRTLTWQEQSTSGTSATWSGAKSTYCNMPRTIAQTTTTVAQVTTTMPVMRYERWIILQWSCCTAIGRGHRLRASSLGTSTACRHSRTRHLRSDTATALEVGRHDSGSQSRVFRRVHGRPGVEVLTCTNPTRQYSGPVRQPTETRT